jgi:hypothetical protein
MKTIAIAALSSTLLAGCGIQIPTISTDFDPNYGRRYAKTGTHLRGPSDLPRTWQDVPHNMRYADRQWLEDLIDEQRQLVPSGARGCTVGSRCTGR